MSPGIEMPKYRSHKTVHALKIAAVMSSGRIVPADEGYAAFDVDPSWMQKHNPQEGGYYVVYADGYTSFSPAKAFEEGYTLIQKSEDNQPEAVAESTNKAQPDPVTT